MSSGIYDLKWIEHGRIIKPLCFICAPVGRLSDKCFWKVSKVHTCCISVNHVFLSHIKRGALSIERGRSAMVGLTVLCLHRVVRLPSFARVTRVLKFASK